VSAAISNTRREVARRILGRVCSCIAQTRRGAVSVAVPALASILAATAAPSFAQQAPSPQPDIGRTEKRFDALEAEQRRAKSTAVPLPQVAHPATSASTRPLFRLTDVAVDGATLMSPDAIAATWRPFLGTTVSQADLVTIAGSISDLYRAAGFHLSRAIVPPQDIQGGRIRIRVIEGSITDIVVKGERAAQFGVQKVLAPIAAERPSRRATLERALLLANDLPGARIADSAIEEIGTGSGRFRLTVTVVAWTNYTAVSLDNRGTIATGPLQAYLASSFNSSVFSGDTFGINLSTVPNTPQELGFGRLFYNAPIGTDGARIGAVASYGLQKPGDIRSIIDTRDRSASFDLRGSVVPLRSRDASLWLTAGFGVTESYEDDVIAPDYRDHIRAVYLTADFQLHDRLNGWNYLTVAARQGLPILGANTPDGPLNSRFDGSGTFSKLTAYYTRYQPLSDAWSIKLAFAGQLVSNPLLASEEFYLGSAFGRGFWGAEISGDNGVGGSIELRYDQALKYDFLKGYQVYGYVDDTVAWNFHSYGDVLSLALVGAGVRFYLPYDLQLGVEAAYPIDYRVPFELPREARGFFYLTKTFRLCPGSAMMRCS
jgi:hemolysin activation/secretion protein